MNAEPPPSDGEAPAAAAGPPPGGPPDSGPSDQSTDTGPTRSRDRAASDDESAAYTAGRENLRPDDHITVLSDRAQDIQFGHRFFLQRPRGPVPEPGPVRPQQLDDLRKRYVAPPNRDMMLTGLEQRHLLVLVGPPGRGRSTSALHLLDLATGGTGKVSRLDPDIDVRAVDERQIEEAAGYLGVLGTAGPTEAQADRLAALFARRGSYCVIVTPPVPAVLRAFHAYRFDCCTPDADDLLARHIGALLEPTDPFGTRSKLLALAADGPLAALGPAPVPSDVAGLAALLVAHGRGDVTIADVTADASRFLLRRIEEWLAPLAETTRRDVTDRVHRRVALRIALAVFDGMPRHVVTATAARLGDVFTIAATPRITPSRPLGTEPDAMLLDALGAEIRDEDISFGGTDTPSQVMRFVDRRVPRVLLTYLWRKRPDLRAPVVKWLGALARDPQPAVRTRAAQAAGLLAALDFSHAFPALIEPAARARPGRKDGSTSADSEQDDDEDVADDGWERARVFAAMALDQAALDERVRPVVDAVLRRWRRSGDPALGWTAARTLGLDLGLRDLPTTLDELRILGTPWELRKLDDVPPEHRWQVWELRWVAGLSLARLFAKGDAHEVLRYLAYWLTHRRKSLRELAQQAVVVIAELRMSAVAPRMEGHERTTVDAKGRGRWPIVLGLTADDPTLLPPVVVVFRLALRSLAAEVVLDVMGPWMNIAADDPAALQALLAMISALVETPNDRARLRSEVRRRRARWADPLPADTETTLLAALDAAPNGRTDS